MNICHSESLALLSAIVRTFTQYTSLKSYIDVCADIITNKIFNKSHWFPWCCIKLDVAHFMKLASQWPSLKTLQRKVREIILRTVGRLVKCDKFEDVYALMLSLFIVITNETNGVERSSGFETSCENHFSVLINATLIGVIELDEKLDEIIDHEETEENMNILRERQMHDEEYEGLNEINPFQSWAEKVYEASKQHIQEGTGINPLYALKIVPHLIKMMKLLPLWSGIMKPYFGYGEIISSSVPVESSFNKLKNNTLKHISLPTDVETFLENHILSLRGASLLRLTRTQTSITETQPIITEIPCNNKTKDQSIERNEFEPKCPLCKSGTLPSKNGAHKCSLCGIPVHALFECSTHDPKDETIRICYTCFETNEKCIEDKAIDKWNRQPKKKLKSSSYLLPNPHIRHLNLNSSRNARLLPLLKNGSRAEELKSCTLKSINANVVLSNTCAFDSIATIIIVSFCDGRNYSELLLKNNTKFVDFISKLVSNGITSDTYTERAELIVSYLNPNLETLLYNTSLITCDTTPKTIFKSLLSEFPTFTEISTCTNKACDKYNSLCQSVCFITYNTTDARLDGLQEFINKTLEDNEFICDYGSLNNALDLSNCKSVRKTTFEVSPFHIVIEVLYWRDENAKQNSEAAPHISLKLNDVPQTLVQNSLKYDLKEVLNYCPGRSQLRDSIGHYTTYTKRGGGNWELYDDLKKKPISINDNTSVLCELLYYGI